MAFRWQADDGPLIVVFESFLPSSTKKKKKKRYQKWTPLAKLFGSAHGSVSLKSLNRSGNAIFAFTGAVIAYSSPDVIRAYPGSEFVVANTLAKWRKLEPNEIDFSQGFSHEVVSRSISVFNSLPAIDNFCHLLITFANSLDLDQAQQNVRPDLDPN